MPPRGLAALQNSETVALPASARRLAGAVGVFGVCGVGVGLRAHAKGVCGGDGKVVVCANGKRGGGVAGGVGIKGDVTGVLLI